VRGSEIARFVYDHPLFDRIAMTAQELLPQIQGRRNTWFAGSYCGFGFHEDAIQSGLWAAEQIGGVLRPWRVANPSARIFGGLFDETRLPASLSPVVA
jgi:predicted NAD/FAD-binding protein